ncbi:MAG: ribosomal protein S18-alanine N-acetyltransferase [Anaerolineae bacterium]
MYILRYMTLDDIPTVMEIDRLSFPLPWSANSYVFEVSDNHTAHMVVLETHTVPPRLVGFGGLWVIADESHISTIAVHPQERGKGLGEALLAGMLARAMSLGGSYCVLEVRVSNLAAVSLYRKYGFEVSGIRRRYYRDNHEDAYTMTLAPMDMPYRVRFGELVKALYTRLTMINLLNTGRPGSRDPQV